jgi:hypothetical protein
MRNGHFCFRVKAEDFSFLRKSTSVCLLPVAQADAYAAKVTYGLLHWGLRWDPSMCSVTLPAWILTRS